MCHADRTARWLCAAHAASLLRVSDASQPVSCLMGSSGEPGDRDRDERSKEQGGSGGHPPGVTNGLGFPRKLVLVLDNAEALLGEGAAGVGVGTGGSGGKGGLWKGPDLLARLVRLPEMVASLSGFAGVFLIVWIGCCLRGGGAGDAGRVV